MGQTEASAPRAKRTKAAGHPGITGAGRGFHKQEGRRLFFLVFLFFSGLEALLPGF